MRNVNSAKHNGMHNRMNQRTGTKPGRNTKEKQLLRTTTATTTSSTYMSTSTRSILSHSIVGMLCFYLGIMVGLGNRITSMVGDAVAIGPAKLQQQRLLLPLQSNNPQILHPVNSTLSDTSRDTSTSRDSSNSTSDGTLTSANGTMENSKLAHPKRALHRVGRAKADSPQQPQSSLLAATTSTTAPRKRPFPDTSKNIFADFATVPRNSFTDLMDLGVPLDDTAKGSEDVLVLYTSGSGMPTGMGWKHDKIGMNATKALENCHEVKVILQEPSKSKTSSTTYDQCIAIVPQWDSYTVHKWMRVPPPGTAATSQAVGLEFPLQSVPRIRQPNGVGYYAGIPKEKRIAESNELLIQYLRNKSRVLANLQDFLKNTVMQNAKDPSLHALVVLTCNRGQAELFRNFVCNARAKGLDLTHVVLFATDEYTANLSKELGIHVWYDSALFGSIPQESAKKYGDPTFSRMMMAKVYCMHLAMSSGYDILFQDVDVVWHRDPLPFLTSSKQFKNWDMVFQDDGSRTWRYAPYSPNSGFYFVRNTPLTSFFFESLLKLGDMIQVAKSHQHVLNDLLIDFASSKGLKVKVLKKGSDNVFPGGVEFHNKREYMKEIIAGTKKPYIFHMSWTNNKENKKKFLEQLGEWYVSEDAAEKEEESSCQGTQCCLAQPKIKCHYRDKPSKIPCLDSPRIDGDQTKNVSFW